MNSGHSSPIAKKPQFRGLRPNQSRRYTPSGRAPYNERTVMKNSQTRQPIRKAQALLHQGRMDSIRTLTLCLGLAGLIGCQPAPQQSAPTGAASAPNAPQTGTGDTGGGTGFRNNFYEAYTVVIEQTSAYQRFIEPVLAHADELEKKERGSTESRVTSALRQYVETVIRSKKWYIIPADLDVIAKEVHGLNGVNIDPTRYGLQTDTEVILTKAFWDSPDTSALSSTVCRNGSSGPNNPDACADYSRASAIWHEVMLGLYILKYKTYDSLCKITAFQGQTDSDASVQRCKQLKDYFNERAKLYRIEINLDPVEPRKSWVDLTNSDYLAVRQATAYFLNRGNEASHSSVYKNILFTLDFDARLFSDIFESLSQRSRLDNIPEHSGVFQSVVLSGRRSTLPQLCRFAQSEQWKNLRAAPCKVTYSEVQAQNAPSASPSEVKLKIELESSGSGQPLTLTLPIEATEKRAQFKQSNQTVEFGTAHESWWSLITHMGLAFENNQTPASVKLGDTVWVTSLALFETGVRAIHLKTAVVVESLTQPGKYDQQKIVQQIKVAPPTLPERADLFIELNDSLSYSRFHGWHFISDTVFELPTQTN